MIKTALNLLKKLNNGGFEAFIVGGAVRNKLLNLQVKDYDITTNATPQQIKQVFDGYDFVEAGIKHGTVGVIVDKNVYEITTYRVDGDYFDHRRPKNITFSTSLKEDLTRRDFTINALAYDKDFNIIDYFDGVTDLKNGIIRAVGDPKKRFTEDALRILRAVRFSAEYGFTIEKNTLDAMIECKSYLKDISSERIFIELNKTLCGKYCAEALYTCKQILFEVIPELEITDGFLQFSLAHDYDVFNHTLVAIRSSKSNKPAVMWSLLFHDIGKPYCLTFGEDGYGHTRGHMQISHEKIKPILERLKFPTKLKEEVLQIVLDHDTTISKSKYEVKKYLSRHGLELTQDLFYVKLADNTAHSTIGIIRYAKSVKQLKYYLDEIIENNELYDINKLAISGDDIMSLGVYGKDVGFVKNELFDKVLQGEVENDKTKLIKLAISICKNLKN